MFPMPCIVRERRKGYIGNKKYLKNPFPWPRTTSPVAWHSPGGRLRLDSVHTDKAGGTTPGVPSRTKTARLNKSAVAAIVLAGMAVLGFFLSVGVLAVFAVGAGHVALNQIRLKGERGRALAIAALGIGYAIATLTLLVILSHLPAAVQQQGL